jgi:hypothetical protein
MRRNARRLRFVTLLTVLILTLVPLAVVSAAPGGVPGKPPDKTEALTNNLSVPAIIVGTNPFPVTCPGGPVDPPANAVPIDGFEIDPAAYYYVQKVYPWQAECTTEIIAEAKADWGGNLEDGNLKAGMPIRVEVGLIEDTGLSMTGYKVSKLEPSLLDRSSPYGTLATGTDGVFAATQTEFPGDGYSRQPRNWRGGRDHSWTASL